MKAMGALDFGMKEEELKPLVDSWREANPKIVKYWWEVDAAIKKALKTKQPVFLKKLVFSYQSGILFIQLPSGRSLAYPKPKLEMNEYGTESVTYMGLGLNKKWERLESYGLKFVENITQAISRDLLMNAMSNCKNYKIIAHVHDEIIVEAAPDLSVETVCQKNHGPMVWYSMPKGTEHPSIAKIRRTTWSAKKTKAMTSSQQSLD